MSSVRNISLEEPVDDHMIWSEIEIYVVVVMLSFLSVIGTLGNALVIYVFCQKTDRLVSNVFIIALAVADIITCMFSVPFTAYMEYVTYNISYDLPCKLYMFLITCNIPLSVLIMVAIAFDRYFCICHPFLHALNITRAKIITAALSMFAAMLGIIVGIQHGVHLTHNCTENEEDCILDMVTVNITFPTGTESQKMISDVYIEAGTTPEMDLRIGKMYICENNPQSTDFLYWYQKCYNALFVICLLIVMVLYSLIYHSVHSRRSARAKQRSSALPLVQQQSNGTATKQDNGDTETTHLASEVNGDAAQDKNMASTSKNPIERASHRRATMRNADRIANLKTALMLFVVTVVFIITYLPAFLMLLHLITYVPVVFYMYFANNVANPLIYGFMNQNFRDDLSRIFCGRRNQNRR